MSDLLVKWASRARPDLVRENFPKWDVPGVRFVFSLDSDDEKLPQYWQFLNERRNVRIAIGKSSCKVEAINRDLEGETFDVICCASDDMTPQTPGWAERVKALMAEHFPDTDGVIHLNDGRRGIGLNTLSIMGKRFYDRIGAIYYGPPKYPDGYRSTHCDDEFTAVSNALNKVVYVDEVLIRHDWVGQHHPDELHRRNEREFHRDAKLYAARKAAGFPVAERLDV